MSDGRATIGWTPPDGAARRCTFTTTCALGREETMRVLIAEPSVSRHHATLHLTADGLEIRCESARGHVRVRTSERLNAGQTARLGPGDRFTIGARVFTVLDVVLPDLEHATLCVNPTCRKPVPSTARDCPWCGVSLAFAQTLPGERR